MKKIKSFFQKNSLKICFCFFVFCMSLFLLIFMSSDCDYFWHIKVGEYMLHHGVLTHDVFSWYVSGKYWMSHEWLSEVFLAFLKNLFPTYHLLVYGFLCVFCLFMILFLANRKAYLKNIPFGMLWVSFSIVLLPFMQGRPHLISFNLLALTIWFLYDLYRNPNSRKIYFLPIISILWANVHGGSSNLPYLFCFVFLIGGCFSFQKSKIEMKRISKKQALKYLGVGALCMFSVMINIHGIRMFFYPYQNMMDSVMLHNINEWAPTNLNLASHYPYLLFLVFTLFILLFSKKKINFMDLILFGISIFLGFKSIRFWAYSYIIMSFVIFSYVEKRKLDRGTCGVLMVVGVALFSIFILQIPSIQKQLDRKQLSEGVLSILKEKEPKRLYNFYDYGGELIFSDIPVFVDGRADLYSPYNFQDYLSIQNLTGDFVSVIQKYDFDFFLVSSESSIATYLKYSDSYEEIFEEDDVVIYQKIIPNLE